MHDGDSSHRRIARIAIGDRWDQRMSKTFTETNPEKYLPPWFGYWASSGDSLTRVDLSDEAIRLARLLVELLPDPEAMGLLALMLLHESRRMARVNNTGDIVLLEEQDRTLWDKDLITEGRQS